MAKSIFVIDYFFAISATRPLLRQIENLQSTYAAQSVSWEKVEKTMTDRLSEGPLYGLVWFNPLLCFFSSEGHVVLDRNPGPGYDTLLLRMIPGDLLSAFPHRQFHTLPGLLDTWAALPNSNPNACMPMQGGSLYHFYDGLWYDPAKR